jgi:hypothetical protein
VDAGVAVTGLPFEALRPVEGVQVYVDAPFAVSVAVCCPTQIVPLLTVTVGNGFTVTVAVMDDVHVPVVPVIV